MGTIDVNCDMAEGVGNEKELMPFISSANIACGYHAGDKDLMRETIDLCLQFNVAVGAHPSFPDRKNFGRTNMNLPVDEVWDWVIEQIQILAEIARQQGASLHHVKPHGALYNMAARDPMLARTIAEAVKHHDASLILYGLSQSAMIHAASEINLRAANEVFADRTYQLDGSLTPRTQPDALITDENRALTQVLQMVKEQRVTIAGGRQIVLSADTLCLHGDGAHAVDFARLIHRRMTEEQIQIKTFR
jgi:UPF0271 protein